MSIVPLLCLILSVLAQSTHACFSSTPSETAPNEAPEFKSNVQNPDAEFEKPDDGRLVPEDDETVYNQDKHHQDYTATASLKGLRDNKGSKKSDAEDDSEKVDESETVAVEKEESFNPEDEPWGSFYDYFVKDVHGQEISLNPLAGRLTLVVNVASECGFTDSTYKLLIKLQKRFEDTDLFNVIAFPCNQFGEQEPEDSETIVSNLLKKYEINFAIFGKTDVIGPKAPDAWKYIVTTSGYAPEWNFWKFLIDREGHVIRVWDANHELETIEEEIAYHVQELDDYYTQKEAQESHQEL